MTTTDPTPASMGGPLSEADRLADVREALADWMDNDDCDALLSCDTALLTLLDELEAARARVGVLEGQLDTAQAQLAIVDEHIAYQHKLGRRISETDDQLEQQRLLGHAEARKALAYALAGSPAVDDEGIDCDY